MAALQKNFPSNISLVSCNPTILSTCHLGRRDPFIVELGWHPKCSGHIEVAILWVIAGGAKGGER